MVARGDLGIECPFEDLPVIQRRAVNACIAQGKPVIIATHMLESMIAQAVPTRAEITDVANAVYEQADCVMLSGETTVGRYPLECIQMLDKIARRIEAEENPYASEPTVFATEKMKVLHSAVVLANELAELEDRDLYPPGLHGGRPGGAAPRALADPRLHPVARDLPPATPPARRSSPSS